MLGNGNHIMPFKREECTSTVTIVAHLFEEGNFQFRARQRASFEFDDSWIEQIDAFETKVKRK